MKIGLTPEASSYIQEKLKDNVPDEDLKEIVIAIYQYSMRSWSGSFCQDVVQLVHKKNVLEHGSFLKLEDVEGDFDIEVYLEKKLLEEWKDKFFSIDINLFKRFGQEMAVLYLCEENN